MGKDAAWEPALGVGRGSYCAGAVPTTGVSYGAPAVLTTCTEEPGCSRKARVMAGVGGHTGQGVSRRGETGRRFWQ